MSWITLFLLSSPSHALLDEPLEPIQYSRIEPANFAEGLCPGNALRGPVVFPQPVPPPNLDLQNLMVLEGRMQALGRAANAAYNVPDFESVSSGAELITRATSFTHQLPSNYRFLAFFSEPEFGMKFMLLQPADESDTSPFILSVIGTESFMPWLEKLLAGHASHLKNSRAVQMFTSCKYLENPVHPMVERGLLVTGHSLGGGLAQAIAYLIQSARIKNGLTPMKLELVTFNAFGGKSLIEKMENFDERIPPLIPTRNYFVEGDVIHKIGVQMGPSYNLGRPGTTSIPADNSTFAHLMSTVLLQASQRIMMVSAFVYASKSEVVSMYDLDRLKDFAAIFYALPNRVFEHTKERIIEMLNEGALTLELTGLKDSGSIETTRFVTRLTYSRELSQRDGIGTISDNELVRELKAIRMRLYRAVP